MDKAEHILERLRANRVRAEYYPDKQKLVIEHFKYGMLDYFYEDDIIFERIRNKKHELGWLWIQENILLIDIDLYTRKEVEELMFNFSKDYIIETSGVKEQTLKENIEIFINCQ